MVIALDVLNHVCSDHFQCSMKQRYVFDENGVNLTLQSAAGAIRDSFNKLSRDGVPLVDPETGESVPWPFRNDFFSVVLCAAQALL